MSVAKHPHVGIHVGGHTVFFEGADQLVELITQTSHANALHVYAHASHCYAVNPRRPAWSPMSTEDKVDHGVPLNEPPGDQLSSVFFQSNPEYYARPGLAPGEPHLAWGDRDAFDELAEPAARAGVQLYVRLCDWGNCFPYVAGMTEWGSVNMSGVKKRFVCPNNPHYQQWMMNLFEDLFRSHPQLEGLNYGHERGTPLMGLLMGRSRDPDCFCEHCCAIAERYGARPERARRGYEELIAFLDEMREGNRPADGAFTTFFRILRNYPEILTWDRVTADGAFQMLRKVQASIKGVDPDIEVGLHIVHHETHDPIYRSIYDVREIETYMDFIKPVLYHNPTGMRMKNSVMEGIAKNVFGDIPPAQSLRMMYQMCGIDDCGLPDWDDMQKDVVPGFTPAYVKKETERFKTSTRAKIYPGIGLDIPGRGGEECSPESVYECAKAAFEGGADGIIISREYDEMQIKNLEAAGRAVKEACG